MCRWKSADHECTQESNSVCGSITGKCEYKEVKVYSIAVALVGPHTNTIILRFSGGNKGVWPGYPMRKGGGKWAGCEQGIKGASPTQAQCGTQRLWEVTHGFTMASLNLCTSLLFLCLARDSLQGGESGQLGGVGGERKTGDWTRFVWRVRKESSKLELGKENSFCYPDMQHTVHDWLGLWFAFF